MWFMLSLEEMCLEPHCTKYVTCGFHSSRLLKLLKDQLHQLYSDMFGELDIFLNTHSVGQLPSVR